MEYLYLYLILSDPYISGCMVYLDTGDHFTTKKLREYHFADTNSQVQDLANGSFFSFFRFSSVTRFPESEKKKIRPI